MALSVHYSLKVLFISAILLNLALTSEASSLRGSSGLPDGSRCYLDSERLPMKPFCKFQWSCVVDKVPSGKEKRYTGHCVSNVTSVPVCIFASTYYSVGTTGILFSPVCAKCTCKGHGKHTSPTCECADSPTCTVGFRGGVKSVTAANGKRKGRDCPEVQPWCLISKTANPNSSTLEPTDTGTCTSPVVASGYCVSAGPGWGPKFYANGTKNVPEAGNFCNSCKCDNGQFKSCKHEKGCKMCQPKKGKNAGSIATQCKKCCSGAGSRAQLHSCHLACLGAGAV